MESSINLAKNLKRYRSLQKKNCDEFASELGISKSTLYKLEHGKGSFSSATLDHISQSLGLTPSELISAPVKSERLAEALLQTVDAFAFLSLNERGRALYFLEQLVALLRLGVQRWMNGGDGQ